MENQFRRVQPNVTKKVSKLVGYANLKNRVKPKSSGVSHRQRIRPEYRKRLNPNSHRDMPQASKMYQRSSDEFGAIMSRSTGGSDMGTQTQDKTEQQREIKELASKLESKQEKILQRKLCAWPLRESTGFGEFASSIVGSAVSQRNQDQLSQFDRDELDLPKAFKTFNKECIVKSAVGSQRVKHIQMPNTNAFLS